MIKYLHNKPKFEYMSNTDALSDTANALNKSGSFLQILVMCELNVVWNVDSEFPVQAAPFTSDPIKHGSTKISVKL